MMQARRKAHARRLATALLHKRAPLVMAQLVTLICLAGYVDHLIGLDSPSTKLIDACEYFSGDMAITLGFREAGLKAVGYDVRYHQNGEMDLRTNHGFILAITLAMSVVAGGFSWFAPVCSSWGFLCSSQSGRCIGMPGGFSNVHWVVTGNLLASRTILLVMLQVARSVWCDY